MKKTSTLTNHEIIALGKQCLQTEAQAITNLQNGIGQQFVDVVRQIVNCKGKIVLCGVGKSGIIAQKMVATLNSTGTHAVFLHATDAMHGDLGLVATNDIVLLLSNSGATPELKVLLPFLQKKGIKLIAIVGHVQSYLAQECQWVLSTAIAYEACPLNVAPTASTTAQLAMCDALAVAVMETKGFTRNDFALNHPGGNLGKRLYLQVQHISHNHNEAPRVLPSTNLTSIIMEISSRRLGVTAVVDKPQKPRIVGIITDGDLRRCMQQHAPETLFKLTAQQIMTPNPKTIAYNALAADATASIQQHKISQLLVTKNHTYFGVLHIHDLVKEGFVL